jgi:hypothetical protein
MKRQTLSLLLFLVGLTAIAFSGRAIFTGGAYSWLSAAEANHTNHLTTEPTGKLTASPIWTLVTQDEAPLAVNSSETNWSRVELRQPRQFYLAGVLIDGQTHLVDLTGAPVENIQVDYVELSQAQPLGNKLTIN